MMNAKGLPARSTEEDDEISISRSEVKKNADSITSMPGQHMMPSTVSKKGGGPFVPAEEKPKTCKCDRHHQGSLLLAPVLLLLLPLLLLLLL